MDHRTFEKNVGEIRLQSDECFWIFPSCYVHRYELNVCSPWFPYLGDMWQFVMSPMYKTYHKANFYLWRKFRCDLSGSVYTLQLKLKTLEGEQFVFREEVSNCDYGFQVSEVFCVDDLSKITSCAQVKLFFVIKDANSSSNDPQCIVTNEDEDNLESESEEVEKTEVKGVERLTENLKNLFLNGQNSDVVLEVHDREFRVHKAILAARSPVFASMFEHDTIEKKSNMVDIPDCTAESFEVFLLYLYTGSADSMSVNNVFNLYYAADKYHIDDLKEECVEYMINILSVETFCDIIALSLRHEECKLQKEATRFFRENMKKIIKTVQWQIYLNDYTTHANELLIIALNA